MDWIKELQLYRKVLASAVIIVETDDIRRSRALMEKRPILSNLNGKENWYTLENWEGFKEIVPVVDNGFTERELANVRDAGGDMQYLLNQVSEKLEEGSAVVVVKNLLESNLTLNNIFLSWATNQRIMKAGSTVIIFLEDRTILPQAVWSHCKIVTPPKSTRDERKLDLEEAKKGGAFQKMNEDTMQSAITALAGLNRDQIDAIIAEIAIRNNHKMDLGLLAKLKVDLIARDPIVEVVQPSKYGFEAIGGYKALKERLMHEIVLPLRNPEYAKEYDIKQPRGLLLFGPPGTGKTLIQKALTKETNMTMLTMQPDKLMSKWVGESEKGMRRFFRYADAMAPCIVFADELDTRYAKRSGQSDTSGGGQVQQQVFSMLLEKLGDENREWFFAANTNLVENIDPAMRRTGRIDSVVPVPYPDKDARVEILKIHATVKRKLPLADDIKWEEIAKKTEMWAGSDLEQLIVRTAKTKMNDAIQKKKVAPITMDDIIETYNTFNISATENRKSQKQTEDQAKRFTNDKRLMDVFEEAEISSDFKRSQMI